MQCSQPLFGTGFQGDAQFSPYQPQLRCPYVIGEGDVMSFRLPDGSVQCYFVPISRRDRWTSNYTNSFIPISLPFFANNNEAWFVRSFLNTYPAAGQNNQSNNNDGYPFSRSYININSQNQGFVQKFHNDGCTSTTDLHYFIPHLRHEWGRGCAAVQVEIPKEEKSIFHYATICSKPCNCNHNTNIANTETTFCECDRAISPMCVDDVKATHSCCDNSRKREKKRGKNTNHTCMCSSRTHVDSSDKAVTTYADQAISCTDMKRREYQSGRRRAVERTDIETEVWYPRRGKSKKHSTRCAGAACESACSLGSVCSDTDPSATRK